MSEAMPRAANYKPLKEIKTIEDAIGHPEVIRRFQVALGDRFDAAQYLSTIETLYKEEPKFRQVDLWELLRCAKDLAELGLRPNTPLGHAWIIPRTSKGKVTIAPQVGYAGMLELAFRADFLMKIYADVVFEGDEFDYENGTNDFLRHKARGSMRGRKPTHAYACSQLKNGARHFRVWDYADVLAIRDRSDAYKYAVSQGANSITYQKTPWVSDEPAMSRKTMIIQLLKEVPRSSEFISRAAYIDGIADSGKISYEGERGDLAGKFRELTQQTSATIYDMGMKQPTVDAEAQKVPPGSKPQPQLDSYFNEPDNTGPLTPTPDCIDLYDADGLMLLTASHIGEWAKEFVIHLRDVPFDMRDAYNEHNEIAIEAALVDPEGAREMGKAGYGRVELPETDAGGGSATQPEDAPRAIQMPTGRHGEADILNAVKLSLASATAENMKAWMSLNQDIIAAMPTGQKIKAYQLIAGRSRDLGIPKAA
jgi:recombination protein RecT